MAETQTVESARVASDMADVALAVAGDSHAFERLYRRHVSRIYTLCCRMVGEGQAEEVTQDVFVRAWEKLDRFGGRAAFGTWLYRVAINVCLGERGKARRHRLRFWSDEVAVDQAPARGSQSESRMDLSRALELLPAGAREVFVLHDVEGYKHREIAEMLGIATGTSKSQLHEARMALRGHLKG